jgi:transposase
VSRLAVQRVFAMDEARFGLKVTHRRLWCPFGSRPPWPHEHQYHWFWLYAAVEPVSGTCVVLFLPHVDGICFQRFLEEVRQHTGSDTIGLVLDNSGSHTSGKWPGGIEKIALPPYSPELNPAERWFEALRRIFANAIFDTLEDLEAALTEALRPYWQNPTKLQRLVGYPWWCHAVAGLNSNSTPSERK